MNNLSTWEALIIVSQIGFSFAAAVVIGLFVGRYIDSVTNLSPIFTVVGALLGTVAGIYSSVQIVRFVQEKRGRSGDK